MRLISSKEILFQHKISIYTNLCVEKVQDTATDLDCNERLSFLNLCSLGSFIHTLSKNHFLKISGDENHPLFSSIIFNQEKRSSRLHTKFRPHLDVALKRETTAFFLFICADLIISANPNSILSSWHSIIMIQNV